MSPHEGSTSTTSRTWSTSTHRTRARITCIEPDAPVALAAWVRRPRWCCPSSRPRRAASRGETEEAAEEAGPEDAEGKAPGEAQEVARAGRKLRFRPVLGSPLRGERARAKPAHSDWGCGWRWAGVRVRRRFASPHALVRPPVKRLRSLDLRPLASRQFGAPQTRTSFYGNRGDQRAESNPAATRRPAAAARNAYVISVRPGLRPRREPSLA